MTHYEELGLRPDATAEEIRQAYRNLARLLHPDQQSDEALKRLAEIQMKRLNSLCDELTDAEKRRCYDCSIDRRLRPPNPLGPFRSPARRLGVRVAGLLAAGMAVAALYWYWQLSSPPNHGRILSPSPALATVEQVQARAADRAPGPFFAQLAQTSAELKRARRDLEAVRAERDSALAQLTDRPPVAASTPPSVDPALLAFVQPPAPSAPKPAQAMASFAGTWFYVRPRVAAAQASLYPAEYIEAVIVEDGDLIRGRYRASYDVVDRAISTQVVFQFEGKTEGDSTSLKWVAAGGARGNLTLKLVSRNSLEASWIATELGSQLGLASGTAVLVRRQEP